MGYPFSLKAEGSTNPFLISWYRTITGGLATCTGLAFSSPVGAQSKAGAFGPGCLLFFPGSGSKINPVIQLDAAGLTQAQLAEKVGTTGSVISRLEDADYEGHSLSMLRRIAASLNKRIEITFIDLELEEAPA